MACNLTQYFMDPDFLQAIRHDCELMLRRALMGQALNVFGVDGNGQFGTDYHGHVFKVLAVNVIVEPVGIGDEVFADAIITLDGYDSTVTGHAITDKNLEISLNTLLAAWHVKPDAWDWGFIEEQGDDFITLELNVEKLIWS